MSNRYKGGIISATPPTTTGGESGTASGAWTLEQQMQAQAAGLWPIQPPPLYIEDVFSTWLYTGNGATQTITNGIDLAGKGGLVWTKCRSLPEAHMLFDTERGIYNRIFSNSTNAQSTSTNTLTAFNSDGFSIGDNNIFNTSGSTNASWTFRKQPKFFDVVTYTGNDATQNIAHNLGSVPGCMIVKRTDSTGDWWVYHRSLTNAQYLRLNLTNAVGSSAGLWDSTTPTSTQFTLGASTANTSGATYVAYLFAHDAGGFGPTESENVISCGSYTGDGTVGRVVDFGYEPQWVLFKRTDTSDDWYLFDTMRELTTDISARLRPNTSDEENRAFYYIPPNATGITFNASGGGALNASGGTYIYIAIRRGPMKTPATGTSVYNPDLANATVAPLWEAPFPVDLGMYAKRDSTTATFYAGTRLTGTGRLSTWDTAAEVTDSGFKWDYMNGWFNNAFTDSQYLGYSFRRAPGFMDVCCYTGTGVARTVAHNLGVAPELMIIKSRSTGYGWTVYAAGVGNTSFAYLNEPDGFQVNSTAWNNTSPTNSVFTVGTGPIINASGSTFVAYLFASCPGVSKVGSYTGTGTTQTIDCGFTAGSRFVLIKRTDSTGDWYVWDSARGIVAGDDPYLLLNSTAAEVTNTDYIDTTSVGFEISSTAPAAINASGGTFIFLAIA